MIGIVRRRSRTATSDAGFTIVEVLVAIVILGIVATSSLYFSLQANTSSSYQQHNQVAITVANQAMENVLSTRTTSNGLYADRGKTTVETAFTANSAVDGVSATYPVWDTSAPAVSNGRSPFINSSALLEGTSYTTTTLIGSCFRPRLAAAGTNCGRISGQATLDLARAAAVTDGLVEETRIVVAVTWSADDECPGGCNYQTSTLLDQSSDLTWVAS